MNRRTIFIPDELWNKLVEEAKQKNINVSAYIRLILSERKK